MRPKILAFFLFVTLFSISCKDDDSRTCTSCSSPETIEFEVCRESNGNASVNGEDTETNYDLYIADLEAAGATCGGG